MASSSNKGSSMTVQTLMTNRQMATVEASNNVLDLRKQKLQTKNKLNLAQISKGSNEISRESNDSNINYKRQYKNVKDLVFKK